jgi:8-oxo-dGTP pyrophosphatase MutT (NUDIX family)
MNVRARAILITGAGRLLTIKRIRPGIPVHWVLPGGGVEPGDASIEAALHREIHEELAGTAQVHSLAQVVTRDDAEQHIYLARIDQWDFDSRTGPEFSDPGKGEHILEEVPLTRAGLSRINLWPEETADLLHRVVDAGADLFALPDLRISGV